MRYTKRVADRLRAPWTALSIETRRTRRLSEVERDRLADTLRLAERLGGEAITVPGSSWHVADDIVAYAQATNATQIVIGKSERARWFEILNGSVVHDLLRRSGNIRVQVICGEDIAGDPIPQKTVRVADAPPSLNPVPYAVAFAGVAAALGVAWLLKPWLGVESVDLVFLVPIIATAVGYGLRAFARRQRRRGAELQISSSCRRSSRSRSRTDGTSPPSSPSRWSPSSSPTWPGICAARPSSPSTGLVRRKRSTLSAASSPARARVDDVLWAAAYQIASMLKVRVVLLLPEEGSIAVKAGYPPEDMLDASDLAAATWAWKNDRPAGRGADTASRCPAPVPAHANGARDRGRRRYR